MVSYSHSTHQGSRLRLQLVDSQTVHPLLPCPGEFEAANAGIVAAVDNVVDIAAVDTAGAGTAAAVDQNI